MTEKEEENIRNWIRKTRSTARFETYSFRVVELKTARKKKFKKKVRKTIVLKDGD